MTMQQHHQDQQLGDVTCDLCGRRFSPLAPNHTRCRECYAKQPLPRKRVQVQGGGAFRTITAKYEGKCKRCEQPIHVGQQMRYGGKGLTYHLKGQCPALQPELQQPELPQPEPEPEPEPMTQCVMCQFVGTASQHVEHYALTHADEDTCKFCGYVVDDCRCD